MFVILNYSKIQNFLKSNFNEINNNNDKNLKKIKVQCNLINEIIDRKNKDNERQCYYYCNENDVVRVDTSIEYPCQPFIMEER
ncbi:MAG: hypothetical protein CMM95_02085 [Rickettsiales bacterium]|nr:hypothetical protein [Rickettsiales bacterium]|tara:strand:+ start:344 stop:592 length:249 start_codon:yes stop_codon:yes gene_type:complete